jgi:hypothetical protein
VVAVQPTAVLLDLAVQVVVGVALTEALLVNQVQQTLVAVVALLVLAVGLRGALVVQVELLLGSQPLDTQEYLQEAQLLRLLVVIQSLTSLLQGATEDEPFCASDK